MNVELFPCSGGMAEGFRRAGITFDVAVDHSADACDSYEVNLGHRPLQMDVNDLHRLVLGGWRPPGVRLLVADPPCTPWSRAGNREGLADERDCLVVTCELIRLLRPRAYLIGNVPGLQDATQWHVVQDVIGGLAEIGYCVRDYVSLDAADYGVPQHRVRPFWFGHLGGPCVRWPAPTHGRPTTQVAIGGHELAPWVTCRDALGHLPIEQLGRPVRMKIRPKGADGTRHGGDVTRCSAPDTPAKTVVSRQHRKGGQILIPAVGEGPPDRRVPFVPNGGDESVCSRPDEPARVVAAHEGVKGGGVLIAHQNHPVSRLDAPAMAVTGGRANRGAQGGRALLLRESEGHPLATPDSPAPTIRGGGSGHSAPQVVLSTAVEHPRHPISRLDEPAFVVKSNGGRAAGNGTMLRLADPNRPPQPLGEPHRTIGTTEDQAILDMSPFHHSIPIAPEMLVDERALGDGQGARPADPDEPSPTVDAAGRGQHAVIDWPWNRPSTTVMAKDTIAPPGHHPEAGSIMSLPNAVVLSERAAAILQGFPEGWLFSGKTKAARWGQIGMAMPPALAEAVARAVAEQIASTP